MTGPCPHYTPTEKTIGDLTLLVCRDCGARLAADAEIIDDPVAAPSDELIAVLTDGLDEVFVIQTPEEIQVVIETAVALGILEESHSAEGIESARIERIDGELVLIESGPGSLRDFDEEPETAHGGKVA